MIELDGAGLFLVRVVGCRGSLVIAFNMVYNARQRTTASGMERRLVFEFIIFYMIEILFFDFAIASLSDIITPNSPFLRTKPLALLS